MYRITANYNEALVLKLYFDSEKAFFSRILACQRSHNTLSYGRFVACRNVKKKGRKPSPDFYDTLRYAGFEPGTIKLM